MTLNRNKLYVIMFMACLAGYIWLYFELPKTNLKNETFDVCLIKNITDIPCPSCGSTRSVIALINGNFMEAWWINPLGYVVAIIMFLAPLWLLFDLVTKSSTFFKMYQRIEAYLKRPKYAIPLILLMIINWIWNIVKGL